MSTRVGLAGHLQGAMLTTCTYLRVPVPYRISRNFFRIVSEHHSYCTGGTSNGEGWQKADAISTELGPAAQECCCSYNMLKLSRHLYGQQPDPALMDYYDLRIPALVDAARGRWNPKP